MLDAFVDRSNERVRALLNQAPVGDLEAARRRKVVGEQRG